jgi:hypothetical protein
VVWTSAAPALDNDDDGLTTEQIAELDRQEAFLRAAQLELTPTLLDHAPPIPDGMPVVDEKALEYGSRVPCSAAELTLIYDWLRLHQENRWDIHVKKPCTTPFRYAGHVLDGAQFAGVVAWPFISYILTPATKWHRRLAAAFPPQRIIDLPLAMIPSRLAASWPPTANPAQPHDQDGETETGAADVASAASCSGAHLPTRDGVAAASRAPRPSTGEEMALRLTIADLIRRADLTMLKQVEKTLIFD